MAVAFRSLNSANFANSTTAVVTKPSGLAVGDLMVAQFTYAAASPTPPSGFTQLATAMGNSSPTIVYYKFAVASDVAATNFTFSQATAQLCAAGIMAFSGASIPQPIFSSATADNTGSNTLSIGSINTLANSILVIVGVSAPSGNSGSWSGYAITTSNPSWTEAWDSNVISLNHGAAYSAVRSAATATGTVTAIMTSGSSGFPGGIVLCIPPDKSFSVVDTLATSDSTSSNITINVADTLITSDTTTNVISRVWLNITKHVSSWLNKRKS